MTATTLWNEAIVVIRTDWALPKYSPGICLQLWTFAHMHTLVIRKATISTNRLQCEEV